MEKGLVFSLWSFFYSAFLQGNLQTYNYILKCMKAYFQSSPPAVVVNLVNLRMLLLYSHMYVGQCGHAAGPLTLTVVFATLGRWQARGTDLKRL